MRSWIRAPQRQFSLIWAVSLSCLASEMLKGIGTVSDTLLVLLVKLLWCLWAQTRLLVL